MLKTKSIPHLLALNEINFHKSNYHSRLKLVKLLVCDPGSSYSAVWDHSSCQRYSYEHDKIFLKQKGLMTCFCISGLESLPQKLYVINPGHPQCSLKIEDALVLEQPSYASSECNMTSWKPSILILTSTKYIHRYDLETGSRLQTFYVGYREYKFISLDWNEPGHFITTKTARLQKSKELVMVIASYSIYPLEFIGLCEIRKSVFGEDVYDAFVQGNILIVHHGCGHSAKIKLYSWESIIELNRVYSASLNKYSDNMKGTPGSHPGGLPCNIVVKKLPPLLFECRTDCHYLQIGGRPWHYMIVPPKLSGTFRVLSLASGRISQNGNLESSETNIESPSASFHPDESSRILIESANSLQVYNIKIKCRSQSVIERSFEIRLHVDRPLRRNYDDSYRTQSGRVVKKKRVASDAYDDVYSQSLLSVDYEDELDLLYCLFDVGEGRLEIKIYCNQTGKLCKSIPLRTVCVEGSQHNLEVDKDIIVHIYKTPFPIRYTCNVYRLSRIHF